MVLISPTKAVTNNAIPTGPLKTPKAVAKIPDAPLVAPNNVTRLPPTIISCPIIIKTGPIAAAKSPKVTILSLVPSSKVENQSANPCIFSAKNSTIGAIVSPSSIREIFILFIASKNCAPELSFIPAKASSTNSSFPPIS